MSTYTLPTEGIKPGLTYIGDPRTPEQIAQGILPQVAQQANQEQARLLSKCAYCSVTKGTNSCTNCSTKFCASHSATATPGWCWTCYSNKEKQAEATRASEEAAAQKREQERLQNELKEQQIQVDKKKQKLEEMKRKMKN